MRFAHKLYLIAIYISMIFKLKIILFTCCEFVFDYFWFIIGETCPRCGRKAGEGVPVEKLHKLGLYKHLNAQTLGYAGDPNEEADRTNNPL